MTVPILTACAGFLLAVLWMDLMFDSQARLSGRDATELDESALASIAGYYNRATTTSQPMGAVISAVMAALMITLAVEAFTGRTPGWILVASLVLAGGPIVLALTRTVPRAIRLGRRTGTQSEQTRLARAILRDHIACLVGILAFLVLWLVAG